MSKTIPYRCYPANMQSISSTTEISAFKLMEELTAIWIVRSQENRVQEVCAHSSLLAAKQPQDTRILHFSEGSWVEYAFFCTYWTLLPPASSPHTLL